MIGIGIIVGSARPGRIGTAVRDWYFADVSKQTDRAGMAEAELLSAQGQGAH
jgi:hypothetical protein